MYSTWQAALKYEIGNIFFAATDERICYAVSGVDSELAAGSWSRDFGKVKRFASETRFRSNARWVGLARQGESDNFIGITANGTLYAFKNLFYQADDGFALSCAAK